MEALAVLTSLRAPTHVLSMHTSLLKLVNRWSMAPRELERL